MSWFRKLLTGVSSSEKKGVPEGVWSKCPSCMTTLYYAELERHQMVCPKCSHHMRLSPRKRIAAFLDQGQTEELGQHIVPADPLKFKDSKKYKDRLSQAQKHTDEKEALLVFRGTLHEMPVVVAAFDFSFIGGSMSRAVGERFVLAVDTANELNAPLICFSTSGGARMQEGLFSLIQMARTSVALSQLAERNLPFISVLLDPTMGGVSASLAMLGDIIIAEPNSLIGFSGPRVIKQTIRETLPEGFQRSNFLKDHGAVDMIVDRRELKDTIAAIISMLTHQSAPVAVCDISVKDGEHDSQGGQ